MPPAKQGDYAYLLHNLRPLKSAGKRACILPHGVLFRGAAEAAIRRSLVQRGYIKGLSACRRISIHAVSTTRRYNDSAASHDRWPDGHQDGAPEQPRSNKLRAIVSAIERTMLQRQPVV